jgi:hypothetical protein
MHGVRGEASKCDRRCGVWPGVDGAKGLRAGWGLPARCVTVSRTLQLGALRARTYVCDQAHSAD